MLIATAYEAKARADAVDDRKANRRQSFPEFLRDFFLHKSPPPPPRLSPPSHSLFLRLCWPWANAGFGFLAAMLAYTGSAVPISP